MRRVLCAALLAGWLLALGAGCGGTPTQADPGSLTPPKDGLKKNSPSPPPPPPPPPRKQ